MKNLSTAWAGPTFSLLLLLGCGGTPSENCRQVCDDRIATECADIEQEDCYNLCDAFMAKSTECAEATEALSVCQLQQDWLCTETGPSLQAPLDCEDQTNIQLTFCIDPPTGADENTD